MEPSVKPGRYRHFKGNEYEVLFCARHSETQEEMVVYRALYGERGLWVRPAAMWNETVERDADAVLEPSYICEALGLQGRLDYMQRDMTSFIEMKSAANRRWFHQNQKLYTSLFYRCCSIRLCWSILWEWTIDV